MYDDLAASRRRSRARIEGRQRTSESPLRGRSRPANACLGVGITTGRVVAAFVPNRLTESILNVAAATEDEPLYRPTRTCSRRDTADDGDEYGSSPDVIGELLKAGASVSTRCDTCDCASVGVPLADG